MCKNIIKFNLLILSAWFSLSVHAAFNDIVIFGDSLSDTGNLASVNGGFPEPPFFMGSRVSNGPVAVEGLADKLGLNADASMHLVAGAGGTNYSVAGARAGGDEPIDLPTQINAYLLQTGGLADADTLYVMFIGGNDIRDARGLNFHDEKVILNAAIDGIDQSLRTLIAVGANHILVVNSPDIGAIPETRLLAASTDNRRLIRKTKRQTKRFNRKLERAVRRIEADSDLDLVLFDIFNHLDTILDNSVALGYSNTTEACFSTVTFTFHPDCNFGQNFDDFLFFDEIHPTGRSHERISRALFAIVPESP